MLMNLQVRFLALWSLHLGGEERGQRQINETRSHQLVLKFSAGMKHGEDQNHENSSWHLLFMHQEQFSAFACNNSFIFHNLIILIDFPIWPMRKLSQREVNHGLLPCGNSIFLFLAPNSCVIFPSPCLSLHWTLYPNIQWIRKYHLLYLYIWSLTRAHLLHWCILIWATTIYSCS